MLLCCKFTWGLSVRTEKQGCTLWDAQLRTLDKLFQPWSRHCSPWPLSGRGCIVHCVFVVCLWASSPPPSSSYSYNPRSEDYPAPWAFFGDSIGAPSALVRLTLESAAQTEAPQHFSGPPRPSLPLQLWFNYTYHIRAQAGSTSRTLMERQGEKRWNTSES